MRDERVKVLYIAGYGRSGSTILSNVLGEVDGFFSAGELKYMWERNLQEDWFCGCGVTLRDCVVWAPILDEAFGQLDRTQYRNEIHLHLGRKGARMRHLPLMLVPGGSWLLRSRLGNYFDSLERLYGAMQDVTGCRVIVDSSKSPAYGHVLSMLPVIDLYVVHLVRDSRATAYSWVRKKLEPSKGDATYMRQYNFVESSVLWSFWNWAAHSLLRGNSQRYLRIRYEDFVDNTQEVLEQIFDFVGESPARMPLLTDRQVRLNTNHTASGNPNRFQTGIVELRPDNEWQTELRPLGRKTVTMVTSPLLRKYGYHR